MRQLKIILKYLLCVFFVLGGLNHFINPAFYLKMMPPYLPWHLFLVYLSGFCEVALGVLLLVPALTRAAAWGLIALLVAVSPANVQMAISPQLYPDIHRQCCENYFQTRKVASDSFSGGDLKERSDERRLPSRIAPC